MAGESSHFNLDEPFDASDPVQVKKRDAAAHRREKDNREVLATLLSSPQGRNWMWDLMTLGHVFETTFVPGDALSMAFREGERNIGLRLIAMVTTAAPDALIQMMRDKGNA